MKEKLFHFNYVTEEDIKRERENIIKNLTEDKKTDYFFKEESLYLIGGGHCILNGFFDEYATKSGIFGRIYVSGKCIFDDGEYICIKDTFRKVINEPRESKFIDFSEIKWPEVKIAPKSIFDNITPVIPKSKP